MSSLIKLGLFPHAVTSQHYRLTRNKQGFRVGNRSCYLLFLINVIVSYTNIFLLTINNGSSKVLRPCSDMPWMHWICAGTPPAILSTTYDLGVPALPFTRAGSYRRVCLFERRTSCPPPCSGFSFAVLLYCAAAMSCHSLDL